MAFAFPGKENQENKIVLDEDDPAAFECFVKSLTEGQRVSSLKSPEYSSPAVLVNVFVMAGKWRHKPLMEDAYTMIMENKRFHAKLFESASHFLDAWCSAEASAIRFVLVWAALVWQQADDLPFFQALFSSSSFLECWALVTAFHMKQRFRKTDARNLGDWLCTEDVDTFLFRVRFIEGDPQTLGDPKVGDAKPMIFGEEGSRDKAKTGENHTSPDTRIANEEEEDDDDEMQDETEEEDDEDESDDSDDEDIDT
ncbi:hypothetical protein MMC10_002824 [Thelotrema lepadinum]|nr:hypothetical protein [Thelotrema lepadinum]